MPEGKQPERIDDYGDRPLNARKDQAKRGVERPQTLGRQPIPEGIEQPTAVSEDSEPREAIFEALRGNHWSFIQPPPEIRTHINVASSTEEYGRSLRLQREYRDAQQAKWVEIMSAFRDSTDEQLNNAAVQLLEQRDASAFCEIHPLFENFIGGIEKNLVCQQLFGWFDGGYSNRTVEQIGMANDMDVVREGTSEYTIGMVPKQHGYGHFRSDRRIEGVEPEDVWLLPPIRIDLNKGVDHKQATDWLKQFKRVQKIPEYSRYVNWHEDKYFFRTKRKVGGKFRILSPKFPSGEECEEWHKNGGWQHVIQELLDLKKPPQMRMAMGRERLGEAVDTPEEADGQFLVEKFGLRAIEFGNWVTQKERQPLVAKINESLTDLAHVVGIEPKEIGLGATLTLGLGSRGNGGKNAPVAHYEGGGTRAINITRKKGAGSLAHEWFHALDDHNHWKLSREMDVPNDLVRRCRDLDKLRGSRQYYQTEEEIGARLFEDKVMRTLQSHDSENGFLVERADWTQWQHSSHYSSSDQVEPFEAPGDTTYPYPLLREQRESDRIMEGVLDRAFPDRDRDAPQPRYTDMDYDLNQIKQSVDQAPPYAAESQRRKASRQIIGLNWDATTYLDVKQAREDRERAILAVAIGRSEGISR